MVVVVLGVVGGVVCSDVCRFCWLCCVCIVLLLGLNVECSGLDCVECCDVDVVVVDYGGYCVVVGFCDVCVDI